MRSSVRAALVVACCVAAGFVASAQGGAEALFTEAVRREALLRTELEARGAVPAAPPLLERTRTLTRTFEDIARLFPASGFGDRSLWHGASLAAATFEATGVDDDRQAAIRLLTALAQRYPRSAHTADADAERRRLTQTRPTVAASPTGTLLKSVRREALPDALRITLELEAEAVFTEHRATNDRLQLDLHDTRPAPALAEARLAWTDDVVRRVTFERASGGTTRLLLDLRNAARHSVYALYSPYRVVIDLERHTPAAPGRGAASRAASDPVSDTAQARRAPPVPPAASPGPTTAPRRTAATTAAAPPAVSAAAARAAAPSDGRGVSLSRQLGLGVGRVVIDPGHGGRDPGAQVDGLNEAELTLDIARRLEKQIAAQTGMEVVLTRRDDTFVSLEERTAVANAAAADLFISIHTNASEDVRARGIETYVLDFASTPAAEAVAARENVGSTRSMGELPDIVRAIALNNKVDESRDFARAIQGAMVERLRKVNGQTRDLGVKRAPFAVLLGATMPSILVEMSFLTNRQEAALLRTSRYRDQIADAIVTGILRYQRSLRATGKTAATK